MDEDLLVKILLSMILVGYYEEIEDEDVLNNNVHNDKSKLDSFEDVAASDERFYSGEKYKKISGLDSSCGLDNSIKHDELDKIEEIAVKGIKPYFCNEIKLSSEFVSTKEVDNDLDTYYEDSYKEQNCSYYKDDEESVKDDVFEGRKIGNLEVLLASIKIPISIEESFNVKREKIYGIENISCDIKEIRGNLLLLRRLGQKSKVKLFYSGILRLKIKYLSIDRIEDKSLYCNTKNLILYDDFSGTINTYIETRMIEEAISVNIPINVDLLGTQFNGRYVLADPTTLYDVKEDYYKGLTIIGDLRLNIALLKDIYAVI
ncbi:hypothetical protein [Clostridium sp. C8-1-8]|uniref:hypothetical protein n=1 Tax=Clostridium sp. C8-1-8 TaxID=2698831 RepID=UPI00136BC64E|nr:hypothetical protein [Clostridium sp. C8-1-8]